MKKNSSTGRALVTSYMTMIISCMLLLGSTFAWFSDQSASGGNLIRAQYAWPEFQYREAGSLGWADVQAGGTFFSDVKTMSPGDRKYVAIRIKNIGMRDMDYTVTVDAARIGTTENGKKSLISVLNWAVAEYTGADMQPGSETDPSTELPTAQWIDGVTTQPITGMAAPVFRNSCLAEGASDWIVFLIEYPADQTETVDLNSGISFSIELTAHNAPEPGAATPTSGE